MNKKIAESLSKTLNKQDDASAEKWFVGTIKKDKTEQPTQVKKELV